MPEFLSREWIEALAEAAAAVPPAAGATAGALVVEPVVRDVPGRDEVRYRVTFAAGGCSVAAPGAAAEPAHVHLETDYATAAGLARGDTNAQAALAEGRLRVSGDVARLAAHASELARLDDLFAAVRGITTYPVRAPAAGSATGERS